MSEDNVRPKLQAKHDWYQTETAVVITVLVKNVKQEKLRVNFSDSKVTVDIQMPEFEECNLSFNLSHRIVPDQCCFKLTPSKIEIKLKKAEGLRWEKLEGAIKETTVKAIPQSKDWSKVERDIKKQEEEEKPEGEEALNKLFQEIYSKGSEDIKRAMNKSYMESGGTVLSTNWEEISKKKVDIKPPDGMEFKKWDS
ncbi:protein SGT1 homolog isoform X2 [Cylas formicarius]|uniref:protein SGT1 homolog isoform X2 n=1 Tax=Cylas formicarius TaxID=197179 RepID=UPI002958DBD6|nr:protein SGT1 homolog isoform X2 [Cylas formicarius]